MYLQHSKIAGKIKGIKKVIMATKFIAGRYIVVYDSKGGVDNIYCDTKEAALKKAKEIVKRRKHVYLTVVDRQSHKMIFKKNTW